MSTRNISLEGGGVVVKVSVLTKTGHYNHLKEQKWYSSRSSLQELNYSLYAECFSRNLPYFGKTFIYPQPNGYRNNGARNFKE